MTHVHRVAVVALLLATALPCFAQSESALLSHPFALPGATTTRLMGMGGFITCLPDAGFANPAFAGGLTETSAVLRTSLTGFDSGLRLRGKQASVAVPLKDNKYGLQVTGFRLGTRQPANLGGELTISTSEYNLALHYGHRVSSNLLLGVGLSPVFHNSADMRNPGLGGFGTHFRGESDKGARFGAVYEATPRLRLGAVYDRYTEEISHGIIGTPPLLGLFQAPIAEAPVKYRSEEIAFGASYQINECLLAAVEWQEISSKTRNAPIPSKVGDSGWRIGFEGIQDRLAFRAGTNDGAVSLGLGYHGDGGWNVNYAFVRNWNEDLVGSILGDSKTHQFEVSYKW